MSWRQGRTATLTQVPILTIAAFLSHLGLGCSSVGHWRPQSPQSASWFSRWHSRRFFYLLLWSHHLLAIRNIIWLERDVAHRLLLCRGVRPPPTRVLDMTLNNLMVRFQQCWSFGECEVPLYCHRSQVHSGPEW